jgi:hypothetical protein
VARKIVYQESVVADVCESGALAAGSLCLNHGMKRETIVTGRGFSTYIEADFDPGWLHFLHFVLFCNALRQIVHRILYRTGSNEVSDWHGTGALNGNAV